MKVYLLILFVIYQFFSLDLYSQDGRLSRPTLLPISYNPALSGNFDGLINLGTGSSWQHDNTSKVAHQFSFFDLHLKRNHHKNLGSLSDSLTEILSSSKLPNIDNRYVGLTVSHYSYGKDLYGVYPNRNPINANFISSSLSYNIYISSNHLHSMGFGLQAVYANANIDERRGVYDKEISGGGFGWANMFSPGQEVRGNRSYLDLNFGTYYRYTTSNIQIEFGFGGYHFTKPKFSFELPVSELKVQRARYDVHSSIGFTLNNGNSLLFRNIFWKEGFYVNGGSTDAYDLSTSWNSIELRDNNQFHTLRFIVGAGSRSFKSVMPYIEMKILNRTNLCISYEEPLKLKSTDINARRFEIGLTWIVR